MTDKADETAQSTPPGVAKDDIEFDTSNPYRARAVPRGKTVLDRARASNPRSTGTYPDIVEGSDSRRTGTAWGVMGEERAEKVETPQGRASEGEGSDNAHPNRNTGDRL